MAPKKKSYSAKSARAGKDVGKPGKNLKRRSVVYALPPNADIL